MADYFDFYITDTYWLQFCGINVFLTVGHERRNKKGKWDGYVRVYELETKKNYEEGYEELIFQKPFLKSRDIANCLVVPGLRNGSNCLSDPPLIVDVDEDGDIVVEITPDMPIYDLAKKNGRNPVSGTYIGVWIGNLHNTKELHSKFAFEEKNQKKLNFDA